MQKLLTDIKTRLLEKVPALRYIDEDWGQLDYYSPDHPVKWPCVLIDIDQVQWRNQTKHIQDGIGQVSVRIADMKLGNTNVKAPANQKTAAGNILTVMEQAYKFLHGWTGDRRYGPMTRISTRKIKRDDGIREFEMLFAVQLVDSSAKMGTIMYPMTPQKIDLETENINQIPN